MREGEIEREGERERRRTKRERMVQSSDSFFFAPFFSLFPQSGEKIARISKFLTRKASECVGKVLMTGASKTSSDRKSHHS